MAGLFYLSHQSSPPEPVGSSLSPLLGHTALYAILAVFVYMAILPRNGKAPRWVTATIVFALAVLYGVSDEVHQAFVAGRVASEADLLADAVGAAIGVGIVELAAHRFFPNNP
jgi:VanZ family protein